MLMKKALEHLFIYTILFYKIVLEDVCKSFVFYLKLIKNSFSNGNGKRYFTSNRNDPVNVSSVGRK